MWNNEIVLGDAYELIRQIPDKSIDLIVTDPPYEYDSMSGQGIDGCAASFDEMRDAGLDRGFDIAFLDELVRVQKTINMYVWVSKKQFKKILDYVVDKYGCSWDLIVWSKMNCPPLCSNQYLHDCEYCLYFHVGVKLRTRYETARTAYFTATNQKDKAKYGHPTIKPEPIIENMIANSSNGGIVFDPFVGSGTTCAVAKRLGLPYLGFEKNGAFHAIAVDRLNGITNAERKSGFERGSLLEEEDG